MSTFLGLIEEIPGISVDRFDCENLASSAFFLSHCHSDHMIGLSDVFFQTLNKRNQYLYCSSISKTILENKYCSACLCVKDLDINAPTLVEYETDSNKSILISVTCIPAGHCPGSVMFLFERNNMSVLYTGDFRINPSDYPKLKGLHYFENSILVPRTFIKIYLDTTFLSRDFQYLPTRERSLREVCEIATEWLNKDPRNVVTLECSALYGSEFLFIELSKHFGKRIHVKDRVYKDYCCIPELSCHITNDPSTTPIHACKSKFASSALQCRNNVDKENVITIIPSVMKWKGKDAMKVGEWDEVLERTFNVCYSTHCSLHELKAFLQYFKAADVYPCVVRPREEKEKIYYLLNEIMGEKEERLVLKNGAYELALPNRRVLNKSPFESSYFSNDEDSS